MTDTTLVAQPTCRPGFLARLRLWLLRRPTRRQHQATIDLRRASDAFKRDLGIDDLLL